MKTKYLNVCDKLRRTEEGEKRWSRMMATRREISEDAFLSRVDVHECPVLDEGETWQEYTTCNDLSYFESESEVFFQSAGFEFIWSKTAE